MDWLVFGDDWGVHPSTTQHLVRHLPREDRVVWVDSIGMRSPRLNLEDAKRGLEKLRRSSSPGKRKTAPASTSRADDAKGLPVRPLVVRPLVVPFHLNALARGANRRLLREAIGAAFAEFGITRANVLSATPVADAYLDVLPIEQVLYLRLDDYARLPGVSPEVVAHFEPRMMARADTIVCTARSLIPEGWQAKSFYLPQGVNWEHFAKADATPRQVRVLGFFGLMAEWIDHRLVVDLARLKPDWTLRFVGGQRFLHPSLLAEPNIELVPAVPFEALPEIVSDWSAAWIPFEISELTRAVNPLKLREYLAAGLPTCSTPLPEVNELAGTTDVFASSDVGELSRWLDDVLVSDSRERRIGRRESVRADSWQGRAEKLRGLVVARKAAA